MSPKLFVVFLILGVVVLSVQAGGHKDSNESKEKSNESKSKHSKEHSNSKESNSNESKPDDDCDEPPIIPKKCGLNEIWTDCGTACPLTCEKPHPGICILKCVAGCQCVEGLLRNKWGKCVEPCDC